MKETLSFTPPIAKGYDYTTARDTRKKIRLQFFTDPGFLKPFRNFVYDISQFFGIPREIAFDIKIMASEAAANIIKHSYGDYREGWIFFEYLFYNGYIEMRFRDFGFSGFKPKEMVMKDLTDMRDRGLGLYIISKIADYYYFKSSEEQGNLFVIKKRIKK